MPNIAEDRVEDAVWIRVVEELPEQHRDDRRDDDRQVGEGAVEALEPLHLAHEHGHEDGQRESEDEREQREVEGVEDRLAEQRILSTLTKLSKPTNS